MEIFLKEQLEVVCFVFCFATQSEPSRLPSMSLNWNDLMIEVLFRRLSCKQIWLFVIGILESIHSNLI